MKGNKSNKYHAVKTSYNGIKYDSKKEARFAQELDLRIKAGDVKYYERQPSFILQPSYKIGKRTIRDIRYIADFKIYHNDGRVEIVDCKGMKTRDYLLKKKIFEYKYPEFRIIEV